MKQTVSLKPMFYAVQEALRAMQLETLRLKKQEARKLAEQLKSGERVANAKI